MLSGKTRLPGEEAAIADSVLSSTLHPVTSNLGATIGGVAGAHYAGGSKPLQGAMASGWKANAPKKHHRYWAPTMLERLRGDIARPFKTWGGAWGRMPAAFDAAYAPLMDPKLVAKEGPEAALAYRKLVNARHAGVFRGRLGLVSVPVGIVLGALVDAGLKGQIN